MSEPASEARPEDIDLEAVRAKRSGEDDELREIIAVLIAAVEALRARVAGCERQMADCVFGATQFTFDGRIAELTCRAESAEAINKEMVGALQAMFDQFEHVAYEGNDLDVLGQACAVLLKARA